MGGSCPCTRKQIVSEEVIVEDERERSSSRCSQIKEEEVITKAKESARLTNSKRKRPQFIENNPVIKSLDYYTEESQPTVNDLKNSREVVLTDGSKYFGQFKNQQFHGRGTIILASGKSYTGHWHHGKMHGKGLYEWPDGRQYKGEFFQNKKHGKGKYIWNDGSVYIGEFVNGLQHGKGELQFLQGRKLVKKTGQWVKGKRISWL